jgi:hypothetical protein
VEKEITPVEELSSPAEELPYEAPRVEDYGTLVDLTAAGCFLGKDLTGTDGFLFLGPCS